MIECKNLSQWMGSRWLWRDLSFRMNAGEWVWLTGRSGSGKSTFIRNLIGDLRPTQGEIILDSLSMTRLNQESLQSYRRKIGVVFQDYQLIETMTVWENLAFAMEVCSYSEKDIQERVKLLLDKVGLYVARNHFPSQLSGGEKQRIAIARALIHQPRWIVADEPTGNLDPYAAQEILDLFIKIHLEGTAVLFATHQWSFLQYWKARMVQIENGALLEKKLHDFNLTA